ncbi:hypothetical protein HOT49_gp248 [Erwinia phage vB_EamM_Alexandra]|uniref:Uncharacterized protein n=1 Tax=Erwinia phage vB_EamM_Alexandra TaxID=2201424 RepID=A0A2Z4QEP3_9CAUD|nr:hypothetical protein HOT49_gp248 [Erwinia phage vB_EamM_Alexandra]AWY08509.1 hypothetical protein Alexandra_250 [Erwinia phage vB_EamM_Alexandra]
MHKMHFNHVPGHEMFEGLIFGSYHSLKSREKHHPTRKHEMAVVYVDITARAASATLFSILKRPNIPGILPVSYVDIQSLRGLTAAREFTVFLSPSLDYIDNKQLGVDLLRFFTAMEATTRSEAARTNVYMQTDTLNMLDSIREASYASYLGPDYAHSFLGDETTKSNIAFKDVLYLINDPDHMKRLAESPADSIILGDDYLHLNMRSLDKLVSACKATSKKLILSPKLHREYFFKVICKY